MTSEPDAYSHIRAFEELSPMVQALRQLQRHCRPFGSDYNALAVSLSSLDEAAEHFTGKPSFYGASGAHR